MSLSGTFVWHELMTTDLSGARAFYPEVVGWEVSDSGMPEMTYLIGAAGSARVAGMMELPAHMRAGGASPAWVGYVAVDDVDATAKQAEALGGSIHREPTNIPGVGRFSVIADPHGAVIVPFKGIGVPPPQPTPGSPGLVSWNELMAGEGTAAFAFYASLFGWTKAEAIDMGPMGVYQIFATADGAGLGGMMTKPADMPAPPHWRYYVQVDGIQAAIERVGAAGGTVANGPHQVPGGSWIVHVIDPQGAFVGLVSATE